MGVTEAISATILQAYNAILTVLPTWLQKFIGLFLLVLVVTIYSIFIWKFYRFVAKKNIINLNLNQYNKYEHAFFAKVVASFLFLVEYIIILPFLIFFWFAVFTLFLVFLAKETMEINSILLVSAIIIAAIRMTSYYKEDLSKDISKLLPFTLLAFFILDSTSLNLERILTHLTRIPEFINEIAIYLLFIILIEIILRLFDFIFSLFGVNDEEWGE